MRLPDGRPWGPAVFGCGAGFSKGADAGDTVGDGTGACKVDLWFPGLTELSTIVQLLSLHKISLRGAGFNLTSIKHWPDCIAESNYATLMNEPVRPFF